MCRGGTYHQILARGAPWESNPQSWHSQFCSLSANARKPVELLGDLKLQLVCEHSHSTSKIGSAGLFMVYGFNSCKLQPRTHDGRLASQFRGLRDQFFYFNCMATDAPLGPGTLPALSFVRPTTEPSSFAEVRQTNKPSHEAHRAN